MGIGDTFEIFQQLGKVQVLIDRLNNAVTIGVMAVAVFFSMVPEMRSGPVAFEQSMEARYLKTSDSVIKSSSGQSKGDSGWSMVLNAAENLLDKS